MKTRPSAAARGVTALLALFVAGCTSSEIQERGWIGGNYASLSKLPSFWRWEDEVCGLPEEILPRSHVPIVVRAYPGTPAFDAGLREGDLILAVNGEPTGTHQQLYDRLDQSAAGTRLTLNVFRFGEENDVNVVVGQERYRSSYAFRIKLFPTLSCDLFPNSDFDVFGLLGWSLKDARRERRGPRSSLTLWRLEREGKVEDDGIVNAGPNWSFDIGIFGTAKFLKIVSQEAATTPETAALPAGD